MPLVSVSDARSNAHDQIAHAVEILGRSKQRIAVFRAIYFGKRRTKTVNEIATATGLERKRVLGEGRRLADNHIVQQVVAAGMTAYQKDRFYSAQKDKILRLVQDSAAFAAFPTKTRPRGVKDLTIRIPRQRVQARYITVDDIDSFYRVSRVRVEPGAYSALPEARFKAGVATVLGETGHFQDWGGERNDLYTSKMRVKGKRHLSAFAFKGPGTRGILTPRKMGRNGDQIQRLFKTPAAVFIVQYWGQIDQSVLEQMEEFAKAKSAVEGTPVYFSVVDGDDSNRLVKAYPKAFRKR